MAISLLVYVAGFGAASVFFLWLRDVRIFARTQYPGYKTAAFRGVLYCALSIMGVYFTIFSLELLGLGLILLALYLQGKVEREKIWKGETAMERFLGAARRRDDKDSP